MPFRTHRSTVLSVAALALLVPLGVGCSAAQKALDCGSTAVTISSDIVEVSNAFGNAQNDPQAAGQALQKLKTDLDKLGRNSSDTDVAKAVTDLQTQVENLQQAANANRVPDLKPLGDAAANLSKVCTG
ncbi:hypothetical protein ACIRBX_30655 [Kitasatospora sp. NPDC096147]|uniref:hypothetical protein n=1 Tax=Kitasatospora sp. NPDC096147 TaxID=3364093 RepID=UPI0038278201